METMQDGGVIQAESKNDKVVCFVRAAGVMLCIQWIPQIVSILSSIVTTFRLGFGLPPYRFIMIHKFIANLIILFAITFILFYLLRGGKRVVLFLNNQFAKYDEMKWAEQIALMLLRCAGIWYLGANLLYLIESILNITGILCSMYVAGTISFTEFYQRFLVVDSAYLAVLSFGVNIVLLTWMIFITWYLLMRGRRLAKLLLWKGNGANKSYRG
jgi:hypothetical protein